MDAPGHFPFVSNLDTIHAARPLYSYRKTKVLRHRNVHDLPAHGGMWNFCLRGSTATSDESITNFRRALLQLPLI